ncbi:unnamed protein product, partial [Coregonus sp. 'balchen']
TGQSRWWEQEIPMEGAIAKGELITHNLTELIKPEAYLVRLTPITRFGEGDSTDRIIRYSAPANPHLIASKCLLCVSSPPGEFQCSFEDEAVCFYMYIETSRPRLEGEKARLLTPTFNVAPKSPYGTKGQSGSDSSLWTLVGNQGDRWKQAKVNIHPIASFQLLLEGIRGPGIEGDIAIDDVTIEEGECKDPPPNNLRSLAPPTTPHIWQLLVTLPLVFVGLQRRSNLTSAQPPLKSFQTWTVQTPKTTKDALIFSLQESSSPALVQGGV